MDAAKQAGGLTKQPNKISMDPVSLDWMPQLRDKVFWYIHV